MLLKRFLCPKDHLHDMSEVFSLDVVVRLNEDLPEPTFPYGVVLGVELVKSVKRVAVLHTGKETASTLSASQKSYFQHDYSVNKNFKFKTVKIK